MLFFKYQQPLYVNGPDSDGRALHVIDKLPFKLLFVSNRVKVADVVISISFREPGNVVRQKAVAFEIFKDGHFIARPKLSLEEMRVADLPPELVFDLRQGKAFSCRGKKDGKLTVIEDLGNALKDGPHLEK